MKQEKRFFDRLKIYAVRVTFIFCNVKNLGHLYTKIYFFKRQIHIL